MSGLLSHRSAVFLDEMGVGPQWRLRARPSVALAEPELDAAEPVPADVTPVLAEAVVPPAPAAAPAIVPPAPPVAQQAASSAPPASGPDTAWDDAPAVPGAAAARSAPAPRQSPAAPAPAPDSAWQDDPAASPVAPHTAALPPAAAGAPALDEAWFDDVPAAPPARRPAASGPVSDEEIAGMGWPALQAAVTACTRCALCKTREAAVPGRGDEQATWLLLDSAPNADDEEYAEPVTGNPGRLLDNMLRAVGQSTQQGAYVTTLVKCRPGNDRAPTQEEIAACRPYLQRELALTQAKVVLALGHASGKGLLGAAARGRIMMHGETPVVATFHPAGLLKRPEEKAKAWDDLCLAKSAHAGRR
jgi:uracil-DNA glycosylase family 4